MKEDERATGGKKRVQINSVRKRAVVIFISSIGLVVVGAYLISELLEADSLTDFLLHFFQPSLIFYHSIVLLTIPAFMLIGHFYQKLKNAHERLEHMIEEKTWILRESEEIRRSEEKFRSLFNLIADPVVIVDGKGKILAVNDKVEEKTGFKREGLLGKNFLRTKTVTAKSKAILMKNLAKRMMGIHVAPYEVEVLTKDGKKLPFEINATKIEYEEKPADLVVFRDITERKQTEEKIKKTSEEWKKTFDAISDLVYILDKDFKIVKVNKTTCDILKKEPEELIGKRCFEVIHSSDKPWPNCPNYKTLVTKKATAAEINDPNLGLPLLVTASPIFDDNGELIGSVHIAKDITKRKKAEEKLRFLKEFNERIVDSVDDALLVIDPYDYTIVSANEAALKQLKLRKEDLVGKTCYETTHHSSTPCKPPHDICPIQEMLKTGKALTVEHTHFDKDNNEIYVEVSVNPVRNQEGKIVQAVHLARNVTERKKVQEVLQESEEKFRNIFNSANDGIIYLDRSGRILDVNRKAVQVFGGSKKELLGKHFTKVGIFSLREMPTLMSNFAHILASKKATVNINIKNKKGQEIPLECSASLMKTDGKPIGIMVIARDVTERKKVEKALRESEEKFRNLAEQSPNMIFLNKKGRIVYANKRCEEIMGYKGEEFYSPDFDFLTLFSPESIDLAKANFSRHMKGEEVPPYESTLITKKGKRIEVIITTKLMRYEGESGILGILTDITERKKAEETIKHYSEHLEELVEERTKDLKEAQKQLLKSERLAAIGEMATMVGHDLRNPLQSIENAIYYLQNECAPKLCARAGTSIPQEAKEMLQVINDSVNYADKIIRDLKDFSAPKKPSVKKTDVNAIVMEALSQVEAPENVELITELDHLPEIKVDKDMMKRVFLNLAINGIQAMENGGRLKVSTKKTKGFVEVSFEDTGIGMPKVNMEKLFTPFFTTKAKGMGMGLPICKRFVDAHDGCIEVESEKGKGSTFTVKLPIQPRQMEVKTIVEE